MKKTKQKAKLFMISGPSGAGEDSVIEALKKEIPIERVTTTSSRKIRPGESQGNTYYFISKKEFQKRIKAGQFLEYAQEYNDQLYGVTHKEIKRVLSCNKIGIWKTEYKGVMTAKKIFPDIIAILINAPFKILIKRIKERDGVSKEFIKERMKYTKEWLKHKHIYDYEVINHQGKLDQTVKEVLAIIKKETQTA